MSSEESEVKWHRIPLRLGDIDLTTSQEAVVRDYARSQGYKTLVGFHWHMRREEINYYDIVRIYYED